MASSSPPKPPAVKPTIPKVTAPKPPAAVKVATPKPAKVKIVPPHPALASTPSPTQFAVSQSNKGSSSLQQYLNYLDTQMGRVNMGDVTAQANAALTQQTQPLLDQNTALLKQEQAGITGFTSTLANRLAAIAPNVASAYSGAEAQQGALDTSLSQDLGTAVGSQADAMGALLAARGQDTSPAAQAAAAGVGAQGASYATGSASLAALIQGGAAANAYTAQLPGVAAGIGIQALGQANAQSSTNASTILSNAQQQLPGVVSSILTATEKQQTDTANALYKAAQASATAAKNANTAAEAAAKLKEAKKLAVLADEIRTRGQDLSANAKAGLGPTGAPLPGYANTPNGVMKVPPGYEYDPGSGHVIKIPAPPKAKIPAPPSTADEEKWAAKALGGARAAHAGVTDSKNVYHPPLTWQQFLTEGEQEGIPSNVLVAQGRKVYSQAEIKQGLVPPGPGQKKK